MPVKRLFSASCAETPTNSEPWKYEARLIQRNNAKQWSAIDGLHALGQIDGLADALARVRNCGERCVFGFQSRDVSRHQPIAAN